MAQPADNQSEVVQQLKLNAREWVEHDEQERVHKESLRKIKQRKDELSESITEAMRVVDQEALKISTGGFLKYSETTTYAPVSKEKVFDTLSDELKDDARAREICDRLWDRDARDCKKSVVLKRTKR